MSSPTVKHVIRMGPITVLAFVIVLSLATMAVLSFATAQASSRMVEKQQDAQQTLYDNERQAQEFLAKLDAALAQGRSAGASSEQVLAALASELEDAQVEGNAVEATFASGARTLNVRVAIDEALAYTIEEWKTQASLDSEEETSLWMG